ncbi:MAG: hypothetical protein A2138_09165 [Deltaproteobacteria bacterium RBG_16_71_12]|nr:MAG: hypothetical protein A2138_09165 [Deltaproteobacteria bacterium RBG_16_71_12]
MRRTTVRLPDDLLRAAKRAAADSDRTLTALIEDALRELLARAGSARGAKRRVTLPVFRGGAGARPGVDIDDSRALVDAMEARR